MDSKAVTIPVADYEPVQGILSRPRGAKVGYVFAHGAGAPMTHHFMEAATLALWQRKIAVLRFNFHYAQLGKKRPDSPKKLLAVTNAVLLAAPRVMPRLTLFAGGKSMGGRICAMALAGDALPKFKGLVFYGFPLHAPGKSEDTKRHHIIKDVKRPMLFLQGERDKLADTSVLKPLCRPRRITLHVVEQGDHSLAVPKRTGKTAEDVHNEVADKFAAWTEKVR